MSRYLISPTASRDLNAIAEYFLTRNVDAGEKLFQEFTKKCQYIAQFSPEFTQDLPELTDSETVTLDQIRNRFLRPRERGSLAEGTINHLVISPLLTLAGLYDEPFFVTTEPEVELLLEDRDEMLRGRIDTLIIQQQLWVLVVESKSTIAFSVALPQALTYLMANPNPERPVYGAIASGGDNRPQTIAGRMFSGLNLLKKVRAY